MGLDKANTANLESIKSIAVSKPGRIMAHDRWKLSLQMLASNTDSESNPNAFELGAAYYRCNEIRR